METWRIFPPIAANFAKQEGNFPILEVIFQRRFFLMWAHYNTCTCNWMHKESRAGVRIRQA
jgi:hypothetical protein